MQILNHHGIDWMEYDADELDTQLKVAKKIAKK